MTMTSVDLALLNAARKAAAEMGDELLRMSWLVSNWGEIDPDAKRGDAQRGDARRGDDA